MILFRNVGVSVHIQCRHLATMFKYSTFMVITLKYTVGYMLLNYCKRFVLRNVYQCLNNVILQFGTLFYQSRRNALDSTCTGPLLKIGMAEVSFISLYSDSLCSSAAHIQTSFTKNTNQWSIRGTT